MRSLPLLLLALFACDETVPLDPDIAPPDNTISGSVVVSLGDVQAPAILLATSAANPGPPDGTGSPANVSAVPASEFTDVSGVQSAPYALNDLPDGDWLITGLLDIDGDFHPNVDALGGATCGDIIGAHVVSLTDQTLAAVSVSGGEEQPGITVALASELPVERPAFTPLDAIGDPGVPAVSLASTDPQGFGLRATAVHAAFRRPDGTPSLSYDLEGPYTVDPASPPAGNPLGLDPSPLYDLFNPNCDTAFLVEFIDADADGAPDPDPAIPGIFQAWPQIGLTWLGTPADADGDGVLDSFDRGDRADESWVAPAAVSPTLLQAGVPVGIPVHMSDLPVVWLPVAQQSRASTEAECSGTWEAGVCTETVTTPDALPRGAWAITVIESTGQTWTVPNALATASTTDAAGFVPALQGSFLQVQ